ncbi:MAG: monofunctional biosynthetic peptidoglycan transglycosylase [Muribaculaceae bacterium]|jgi:monofunctional biosynthetic peptidoglycan transglycosylase|nr:monofunctional biosynthetic peptidoglycan transglycosylase [Muribaculaceae bacterium]MBQ2399653.1 monofunctional biosynthetic peptidoglycan transglycosylase [Muribaculaceae bacterium]MBQ2439682.1 monofunctional biosynthetic peptidoglycan transglycosylase [Muribaculaceae bacterium]MBR5787117.1 monofunctional biosynthetic peptidoglycan transglycosylase [Muribaculaceae bacterium]MEE1365735.1 monofunctional biosynthetic peptidoglycan transglycosylase [Muribaculaceae bacterium]
MKTITRLLVWIIVFFFGSTIAAVVVYKWMPVYITPLMITRSIENDDEMQHKWVPIEEISENMALAVVSSEDNLFMSHSGFDFDQIQKAIEEAEKTGRQRGASTISQQTAKNVFLWNGRSWVRKGLEAYFTVLIELIWGKERIMEVYLNSIEMGPGIYGAEAVAQAHFGKSASKLTRREAALIAATLPNPLKYSSKNPSKYMRKRQRQITRLMGLVENPHIGC